MRTVLAVLLCLSIAAAAQSISPQIMPWIQPSIVVGVVNTLSSGAPATASLSGSAPNYSVNLGIPAGATGASGAAGADGTNGTDGTNGSNGAPGPSGPSGPDAYSAPSTRTVALATAYQCSDPTAPCEVTINLTSSASLSLTAGTSNTADILVGPTNAVAGGTGVIVGKYANSITGVLIVGLGISTVSASPTSLHIPTGYYFAVRQTAGTVAITSAFDQKVG